MMKNLVILLACLGLGLQLSSCTSKDSHAESEVAADVDSADLEKLEGESAAEVAAAENAPSDQLPEEALGEATPTPPSEAPPVADVAATTPEALPPDPFAESGASTQSPTPSTAVTEVPTPSQSVTMVESEPKAETAATTIIEPEPTAPKVSAPLQKMAAAPWKVGKVWFNTVYFARPGDTLKSISKMIYGSDKTKELKKGNVTFKTRDVKPGDKVYYNSPNRPDDSARMITFYEDSGIASEVYVAKAGDNIKKVSKKLLGYEGAWKEVWASNIVDSKGVLPEGTELRFWKGGAVAAATQAAPKEETIARNEVVPPAPAETLPAAETPAAPAMPPEEMGLPTQAEMPPPPPMPEQQAGMEMPPPPPLAGEMEPPPPPPPAQAVNPPPPPPKKVEEMVEEPGEEEGNKDMTTALAGVVIIAAGAAGLIVLRKRKKQKELDQQASMENTHVGT